MVSLLSAHAKERMQQRAISPLAIELLVQFGTSEFNQGCEILFFDKKARQRLQQYAGQELYSTLLRMLDVYIVVDGAVVVTAARKVRHHKRDR